MKSITQTKKNDSDIEAKIAKFFSTFHLYSALKEAGAYRQKGFSAVSIFAYVVTLLFQHKSMYMDIKTSNQTSFAKDTVYRFLNDTKINWSHFLLILSSRIIDKIRPLTSDSRRNVIIFDDSTYERSCSKKAELLAKIYDHSTSAYKYGYRLLTMMWSDGNTSIPLDARLISTENAKNRINDAKHFDKRSNAYKIRQESQSKANSVVLEMLKRVKKYPTGANYVLFDTWFCFPTSLINIKELGFNVIGMIKKTPKQHFVYNHKSMPLTEIYRISRKRRGNSKYLLSVIVQVCSGTKYIPAKVVYVRDRNNRKKYLCIISTDTTLSEEEIIQTYGKRWNIEVFFKICKSQLKLTSECRAISYDAMTAHVAIVFTRYMILAYEQRCSTDQRTIGEIFVYLCKELNDISFAEALQLVFNIFIDSMNELEIEEQEIETMVSKFLVNLPQEYSTLLPKCA